MYRGFLRSLVNSFYKTTKFDGNPSIFDIAANESLLEGVLPAFKHLIKIQNERSPSLYNWIFKHADELYLCLHSTIQFYYLKNYGASFAEHFYDLKRVPFSEVRRPSLPIRLVLKSLFTLTLLPYLDQLLSNYYKVLENDSTLSDQKITNVKLKNLFRGLWPKFHFVAHAISLIYYLRFIVGSSKVHSPLLHVSGVSLAYASKEDLEYFEKFKALIHWKSIRSARDFGQWLLGLMGLCFRNSLELSAFLLQFLEFFYSNDSIEKVLLEEDERVPPPPPYEKKEVWVNGRKLDKDTCPICLRKRSQDTLLAVSGYVFCYRCVLLHVRQNGSCPVTGYPANTTKQLIRIYEE